MRDDSNAGTKQVIKASRRKTRVDQVCERTSPRAEQRIDYDDTRAEDRRESQEGSVPSHRGTQTMELEACIRMVEGHITGI